MTAHPSFKSLKAHFEKIREMHLRQLFADDPKRGERMTLEAVGLFLVYSKNRVTDETLRPSCNWQPSQACGHRCMFAAKINITEPLCFALALRFKRHQSSWQTKRGAQRAAVPDKMTDFQPRPQRHERPYRQTYSQRDQHRHRRVRQGR
jgi:glucose-6-phosphate isomerase